jgi:glyoxylase-like metal-dependent hydrolase (beta-lactamase superfamily II)
MLPGENYSYDVVVLKPGILKRDRFGNILDARSTVVLISGYNKNIIVDSGLPEEKNDIISALSKYELKCDDIDFLIITHLHPDHTGNNNLFHSAKILKKSDLSEIVINSSKHKYRYKLQEILPGLSIMETPGHTKDSISVLTKMNLLNNRILPCAITGDALPIKDNYTKWVPPGINYNPDIALQSMGMIVDLAKIIIPGHDRPFEILDQKLRKAKYI